MSEIDTDKLKRGIKIVNNGGVVGSEGTTIVNLDTGESIDLPIRYIKWEQRWSGDGPGEELPVLTLEIICLPTEIELPGEKEVVDITNSSNTVARSFALAPKKKA